MKLLSSFGSSSLSSMLLLIVMVPLLTLSFLSFSSTTSTLLFSPHHLLLGGGLGGDGNNNNDDDNIAKASNTHQQNTFITFAFAQSTTSTTTAAPPPRFPTFTNHPIIIPTPAPRTFTRTVSADPPPPPPPTRHRIKFLPPVVGDITVILAGVCAALAAIIGPYPLLTLQAPRLLLLFEMTNCGASLVEVPGLPFPIAAFPGLHVEFKKELPTYVDYLRGAVLSNISFCIAVTALIVVFGLFVGLAKPELSAQEDGVAWKAATSVMFPSTMIVLTSLFLGGTVFCACSLMMTSNEIAIDIPIAIASILFLLVMIIFSAKSVRRNLFIDRTVKGYSASADVQENRERCLGQIVRSSVAGTLFYGKSVWHGGGRGTRSTPTNVLFNREGAKLPPSARRQALLFRSFRPPKAGATNNALGIVTDYETLFVAHYFYFECFMTVAFSIIQSVFHSSCVASAWGMFGVCLVTFLVGLIMRPHIVPLVNALSDMLLCFTAFGYLFVSLEHTKTSMSPDSLRSMSDTCGLLGVAVLLFASITSLFSTFAFWASGGKMLPDNVRALYYSSASNPVSPLNRQGQYSGDRSMPLLGNRQGSGNRNNNNNSIALMNRPPGRGGATNNNNNNSNQSTRAISLVAPLVSHNDSDLLIGSVLNGDTSAAPKTNTSTSSKRQKRSERQHQNQQPALFSSDDNLLRAVGEDDDDDDNINHQQQQNHLQLSGLDGFVSPPDAPIASKNNKKKQQSASSSQQQNNNNNDDLGSLGSLSGNDDDMIDEDDEEIEVDLNVSEADLEKANLLASSPKNPLGNNSSANNVSNGSGNKKSSSGNNSGGSSRRHSRRGSVHQPTENNNNNTTDGPVETRQRSGTQKMSAAAHRELLKKLHEKMDREEEEKLEREEEQQQKNTEVGFTTSTAAVVNSHQLDHRVKASNNVSVPPSREEASPTNRRNNSSNSHHSTVAAGEGNETNVFAQQQNNNNNNNDRSSSDNNVLHHKKSYDFGGALSSPIQSRSGSVVLEHSNSSNNLLLASSSNNNIIAATAAVHSIPPLPKAKQSQSQWKDSTNGSGGLSSERSSSLQPAMDELKLEDSTNRNPMLTMNSSGHIVAENSCSSPTDTKKQNSASTTADQKKKSSSKKSTKLDDSFKTVKSNATASTSDSSSRSNNTNNTGSNRSTVDDDDDEYDDDDDDCPPPPPNRNKKSKGDGTAPMSYLNNNDTPPPSALTKKKMGPPGAHSSSSSSSTASSSGKKNPLLKTKNDNNRDYI